jgi:hypothetical protein
VYEKYVGEASAEIQPGYWAAKAAARFVKLRPLARPCLPGAALGMANDPVAYRPSDRGTVSENDEQGLKNPPKPTILFFPCSSQDFNTTNS